MTKHKDQLEEIKEQLLPKSIDLHSMVVQSFAMDSEPTYINTGGPLDQLLKEDITHTFQLIDTKSTMVVTISITKTVHHELKD